MIENMTANNTSADVLQEATRIASRFDIAHPVEAFDFPGKGNINRQTYWIQAGPPENRSGYLLQLLNPSVFRQPRAVMSAMISCLRAQEQSLSEGRLAAGQEWETIRLVPTKEGKPYLEIEDAAGLRCWRLMDYIHGGHSFKSLQEIPHGKTRLLVAEEAGKGLALFGALTAQVDPAKISCPLPGYRDTALYYDQFLSILAGHRTVEEAAGYMPNDTALRQSTEPHFCVHLDADEYRRRLMDPQLSRYIDMALEQKSYALTLARKLADGDIRRVVIHGDTKLENFLFSDGTEKVKALVDLDTIMPHTWLSDWGDMVRSLTNIAGEKETNLDKVRIDLDVFKAAAKGYLSAAHPSAMQEVELMADAPQIMALELGVRFLTDYLRGDSYFALGPQDPADLNKTRAMVQFRVFENLRQNAAAMKKHITS